MKKLIGVIGVYIRVSTQKQKMKGYSLDQQINLCTAYAKEMYPDHDIRIYNDGGFSGGTLNRPALKELLNDIKKRKINIMMFTDLDRLTRGGVPHTEYLLTFAADNNCEVICLYQNVNISDPDEEFNTYLNSLLASRDRKKVSVKTKRGIAGGLEKGIYTLGGVMPLGYKRGENKKIEIIERESLIIQFIFDKIIEGIPLAIISNQINENYGIVLQDYHFYRIIKNKKYKGVVIYEKKQYTDIIPAIINPEKWELAQLKYKDCLGYQTKQFTYLFSNKISCKHCNQILLNRSGYKKNKKYYYLHCKHCKRWINQDKILILLEDKIIAAYKNYTRKNNKNIDIKIKQYTESITKLNKRLERLETLLLDNIISADDYLRLEKKIKTEISYFEEAIKILEINISTFKKLPKLHQKQIIQKFINGVQI